MLVLPINLRRGDLSILLESLELGSLRELCDQVVGRSEFVHLRAKTVDFADRAIDPALVVNVIDNFLQQGQRLMANLNDPLRFFTS